MASQDKLKAQAMLSRIDEARRVAFQIQHTPRTVIDFTAALEWEVA